MAWRSRSEEPEIMDDLEIGGADLKRALREIDLINHWLGGQRVSYTAFDLLTHHHPQSKYSIMDIGCGSGDLMWLMKRYAERKNITTEWIGVDANPHILEYASEHWTEKNNKHNAHYPAPAWETIDIFSKSFESLHADIIHSSLFTHHFTRSQLIQLFKLKYQQCTIGFIVNDLHRHPLAYYGISALTKIASRSTMVRNDAKLSVLRGFTRAEIEDILDQAGIMQYILSWSWAWRWRLVVFR